MLKEIRATRQIPEEPSRRWFSGEDMDLIVWQQATEIVGFQLCYDKLQQEKALSWKPSAGFVHELVDSGENRHGHYKATPILTQHTAYDLPAIRQLFIKQSSLIDEAVRQFVLMHLDSSPN
ncbi:MAG: hypothetical protein OEY36_05100 [Gammaproteobacteria bacterium]|nr:hypothetical protein [Gammaproteobacteria bacterium]